jgi:hypothetical protein
MSGATVCTAANCPIPEAMAGSRRTAARVTRGATSLSSSSHFPLIPYSKIVNPVALPPGRAKLVTKPAPTGSMTCTNTIGRVRVACRSGTTVVVPVAATRTSGASATNSAACLRTSSALVVAQRVSTRTFPPSLQPNRRKPCINAAMRAWDSESSAALAISTPMRRIPSACCARAASGHAAAAPPPSSAMSSRRFTQSPRRRA